MKKVKRDLTKKLSVSGMIIIACTTAYGQQNDSLKTKQLNPVVISATRMEKNPDSIGRSISVITSQQLQNSVFNSLGDALVAQENIYVVGIGQNPGMAQSIFMRGANSNQTEIMIDGIKIADPSSTNNAVDLSELSIANIDHVEIVRGSHSTLFGSSAIGGVINIITKKDQQPGFSGDAAIEAGTFGKNTSLLTENISFNYTLKNGFYANAEVFATSVNGLCAAVDTITNPKTYNRPTPDNSDKMELNAKIGYRHNKVDAFAAFRNVDQDADIAEGAYQANNYNYAMNFKRELFSYGAAYKFNSKLSIQFNGGYSQMRRYAQKDSSIDDNAGDYDHTYFFDLYKGTMLTNELQANYATKGFDIVAGGGLFDETMASDDYYYDAGYVSQDNLDTLKINVLTRDVFVHTDIDGSLIGDKFKAFSLALGYRYTYHQLFGSNSTFEINPSYRIAPNTLLYGSYSTGFNAPSLYELYAPDITPPLNVSLGNKYLKPETSKSWEAGIKYSPTAGTTFTASYFFTEIDNTVEFVYLWNKNKQVDSLSYADYLGDTYLNLGKQSTQGFEFSVSAAIGKKLLFEGNVSIMGGKLEYSPASIDTAKTHGNYVQLFDNGQFLTNKSLTVLGLTRRPNTANFSLTYRFCDKISLRMDARYVGSNNDICFTNGTAYMGAEGTVGIEDYALMDLSLKYIIFKNFSAIAKCENVFNKKYVEIYGFTTKGRGIYLSLRYAF